MTCQIWTSYFGTYCKIEVFERYCQNIFKIKRKVESNIIPHDYIKLDFETRLALKPVTSITDKINFKTRNLNKIRCLTPEKNLLLNKILLK